MTSKFNSGTPIVPVVKSTDIHIEVASYLFYTRTQIHIYHLQTKRYSNHKILNKLYDKILDQTDTLIETLQGKLGIVLKGYKAIPYLEDDNPVGFIKNCISYLQDYRTKLVSPEFDNINSQVQIMIDTLEGTLYLLTLQ